MLSALSVDTITVVGAINAVGFTTTGTATLGSINTDIMYVSTLIQSAGPASVGSFTGGGVWTDTCKLEANGNITCVGTLTAPNIYTKAEVNGLVATKASTTYLDNALASKQNTLTFVGPINLGTPIVG